VWLTVVLYSCAGIAVLHMCFCRKGKHNGLRDVAGFVVTELPCLEERFVSDLGERSWLQSTTGRHGPHSADNGKSEYSHGSGT
jgi:hypothetical protein